MGPSLTIDHIAVACERLEDGIAHVEAALGVAPVPGGKHPAMGTHNALLNLGDAYLEVIAIDPDAPKPDHPRWFALDEFRGPPRLANWVVRTDDIDGALALAPTGAGVATRMSRGDLSWIITIPANGHLPHGGAFPAMMDWGDTPHPTTRLPDSGCRLVGLEVLHPEAEALRNVLAPYGGNIADCLGVADVAGYRARIATPTGLRVLT